MKQSPIDAELAGLGEVFLLEVLSALERIRQYPKAWRPLTENRGRTTLVTLPCTYIPIFLDVHFLLQILFLQKLNPAMIARSLQRKINKHRRWRMIGFFRDFKFMRNFFSLSVNGTSDDKLEVKINLGF